MPWGTTSWNIWKVAVIWNNFAYSTLFTSWSDNAEETLQYQRTLLIFETWWEHACCSVRRICYKPWQNDFKVLCSKLQVDRKFRDTTCPRTTWQNQPWVGDKSAGNMPLAVAMRFSGCPVAAYLRTVQSIKYTPSRRGHTTAITEATRCLLWKMW